MCSQIYYNLKDAIEAPIDSDHAFIIAHERRKKSGEVGRSYIVFNSFRTFLKTRDEYPHSHEVLVDHLGKKPDPSGRLVFDFDVQNVDIPESFETEVEDTVYEVLEMYFQMKLLDFEKLRFVWSTTKYPNKFSKHLTVKHFCFENWIEMIKIFYQLFSEIWDEHCIWIKSEDLLDIQIARNRASLRMVGSSKIGGRKLKLDNPKYELEDSLIRLYTNSSRNKEQMISYKHFHPSILQKFQKIEKITKEVLPRETTSLVEYQLYDQSVYEDAYQTICREYPNVFDKGKIYGTYVYLLRRHNVSNECLLCRKKHDSDNAYLILKEDVNKLIVSFGCFRFRKQYGVGNRKTTKRIGTIPNKKGSLNVLWDD